MACRTGGRNVRDSIRILPPNDFSETNADADGDGYTNIEEYLQWMATNSYSE